MEFLSEYHSPLFFAQKLARLEINVYLCFVIILSQNLISFNYGSCSIKFDPIASFADVFLC